MTLLYRLFDTPRNLEEFLKEMDYKNRASADISADISEGYTITQHNMLGGSCKFTIRSGDIAVTVKNDLDMFAFVDQCQLSSHLFAISLAEELTSRGIKTTIYGQSIEDARNYTPVLLQRFDRLYYGKAAFWWEVIPQ